MVYYSDLLNERPHSVSSLPVADHRICYYSGSSGGCSVEPNEEDDFKEELGLVQFGKFYKNETLQTTTEKYEIVTSIGKGTFGEVLLGCSHPNREYVAIKVLKGGDEVAEEAAREINFLRKLKEANGSRFHLLQIHYAFICKNQYCLVLEKLEQTLHSFMERRNNLPLRVNDIRPILKQLFVALDKLQELQIIHTDLKPENIMLVSSIHAPYRIKIVDFGSAITLDECSKYKKLQTIHYRAPEVILGAPFGHAIDVWSVGCIAAELYLGSVLYQGYTSYDQMRLIYETQGCPETEMLEKGVYTRRYFNQCGPSSWSLKNREGYQMECTMYGRYKFMSLDDLRYIGQYSDPYVFTTDTLDTHNFVDLLKEMLSIRDTSRISAKSALQHTFISMTNLLKYYHNCTYTMESHRIMKNV